MALVIVIQRMTVLRIVMAYGVVMPNWMSVAYVMVIMQIKMSAVYVLVIMLT